MNEIDADLWQTDTRCPTQVHCNDCGAYYIIDNQTGTDCPVCGFAEYDIVCTAKPPKQVDLEPDE